MEILFDVGNTHTHIGLATASGIRKLFNIPTSAWFDSTAPRAIRRFTNPHRIGLAAVCSVVPKANTLIEQFVRDQWCLPCFRLTHRSAKPLLIDYPSPGTIGADRLANAIAAVALAKPPVVVVDFGTAVTFDVIDKRGCYIGGIIAPGLSAMTDYLHEKTALLPKITIRKVRAVVGKNTQQAMLIGAVHGYRGLVKELIAELSRELKARNLMVIATGGYAGLIAEELHVIRRVIPGLTLEGLRIAARRNTSIPLD